MREEPDPTLQRPVGEQVDAPRTRSARPLVDPLSDCRLLTLSRIVCGKASTSTSPTAIAAPIARAA